MRYSIILALFLLLLPPMVTISAQAAGGESVRNIISDFAAPSGGESALFSQNGEKPSQDRERRKGLRFQVGPGLIVSNNYRGADTVRVLPIPFFDIRYKSFFLNPGQGFGFETGKRKGPWVYAVSAAIAPQFGNRDASDIPGLPEVNFGVEARAGVRLGFGPFTLEANGTESLFGTGHQGATLDVNMRYGGRFQNRGFWGVGPGIRFISDNVANAFYTVRPQDVAVSGLPAFAANGGLETVNINGIINMPLNDRWMFTAIGEAGLLVGRFANSPITETRFQSTVVTALVYRF